METPVQTCGRLLASLEDLIACEAIAVREGDFATVGEIQRRAAPLIEHLAAQGSSVLDVSLRARVGNFLRLRTETVDRLAAQIAQTRVELDRTQANQRQVGRIAPVYGSSGVASRRQLLAVG